jgi:hypothetical protein
VEYTDDAIRAYIAPAGRVDTSRLLNLPTLVMPETGPYSSAPQVARVGGIENLVPSGSDYRFRFVPNPTIPPIPSPRIVQAAALLNITDWEFTRTHWSVKDIDLYRVLHEHITGVTFAPQVFKSPVDVPQEPDLVAVMMPFDAKFNPVYESLRTAVAAAGLRCHLADDIWENNHIMDDVISLIWRARVVVADLTAKNPNVLYETGVAHTLGRDVIQIAQSIDDIPFDLRSIRSLQYLPNTEGLGSLGVQVAGRLQNLVARA